MSRRWLIRASAAVVVVLVACGALAVTARNLHWAPSATTEAGPDAFVATDGGGLVAADLQTRTWTRAPPACDLGRSIR